MTKLRSRFYSSYEAESAMLPTRTQKVAIAVLIVAVLAIALEAIPSWIPGLYWLQEDPARLRVLARVCVFAIAALGLNLLTGVAGQVSLGHSFFMGIGAFTAVVVGGEGSEALIGYGLPMWIWLPAAGVVAAGVGAVVAPVAVRVRGLYLAFVTLGLVFIGEHIFRNWNTVTGDAEAGREFQRMTLELWKEGGFSFHEEFEVLGVLVHENGGLLLLTFSVLVGATIVHKNLMRSRTGRAWQAIRDRDIAAEVMGIPEAKYKMRAFAISSAYAGVAGALLAGIIGNPSPTVWNLNLAVQIIAIVLIGGAGTTAGILMGAFFVVMIPEMVDAMTDAMVTAAQLEPGFFQGLSDLVVSTDSADRGIIGLQTGGPGLSKFQMNQVLYGLLIVAFLIFEPLGLYGIWIRVRNYWKTWPFTY
jgi:branched-chain amino acid transport system permease protein